MRIVDMRKTQSTKRRLFGLRPPKDTRPYVLSYEAVNRDGERVRYVRNLSQQGIELLGAKLAKFPPYDQRVGNISVTRPDVDPNQDVSNWFACFTEPTMQATPLELRSLLWMLTYEPSTEE